MMRSPTFGSAASSRQVFCELLHPQIWWKWALLVLFMIGICQMSEGGYEFVVAVNSTCHFADPSQRRSSGQIDSFTNILMGFLSLSNVYFITKHWLDSHASLAADEGIHNALDTDQNVLLGDGEDDIFVSPATSFDSNSRAALAADEGTQMAQPTVVNVTPAPDGAGLGSNLPLLEEGGVPSVTSATFAKGTYVRRAQPECISWCLRKNKELHKMSCLFLLAVLQISLDAYFYVGKGKGCADLDIPRMSVFGIVKLVCYICFAVSQWEFQRRVLNDMVICKDKITELQNEWRQLSNDIFDKYRSCHQSCRSFVKDCAEYWSCPLILTIAIHGVGVGVNVAQIILQLLSYQSSHTTTATTTAATALASTTDVPKGKKGMDDVPIIAWHAILGVIYTLQLLIFLPQLCSINTYADQLETFVMEELQDNPPNFRLETLGHFVRKCPVSFPVMGFRITSRTVFAGLMSVIGLMLTAAGKALGSDMGVFAGALTTAMLALLGSWDV